MHTAVLRFCLLGPFEAWRNDERILPGAWRTRQNLALLKLLLDERDRTVPFDRLIDLIWPDSDPTAARHSLRVAIRTLRLALEPDLARGATSRHLQTEPQGYRFVSAGCAIDVVAFLGAWQRGAAAERRGEAGAAIRAYQEAAGQYRGDYLADDPYAEWALGARERLQATYLAVLDGLGRLLAGGGDYERAITWLERALAVDPVREELYRQVMRCHGAVDRRSHALAAFERCRKVLQSELGVEPATETRRLRDEIAARQPAAGPMVAAPPAIGEPIGFALPFVGRERELATLWQVWLNAQVEPGQVVLVTGAPGIGKTKLAQQVVERVGASGAGPKTGPPVRTYWLAAFEAEAGLAFAPLTRLLAGWLEQSPSGADLQRLGRYTPTLVHLLPQARAFWPDAPLAAPMPQAAPESAQLLEALTQALLVVKGAGPGLIVLDDLHWADPSTLLWLGYALRRFPPGVLVVATCRPAEPPPPGLPPLIAAARRAGRLTELGLDALSAAEVDRLLAASLQVAEERSRVSQHLYAATAGEPLFVVEAVRELLSRGWLYADAAGGWRIGVDVDGADWPRLPLTATVREMIAARVARLDALAREVFTAVCVIGVGCRAELVAAVVDRPLETVLGALDTLLERQLLRTGEHGQSYSVEHPLIRRIVYDGLSPGRRQGWHLRAAQALGQLHADHPASVAGQVLRHLVAGDAGPAAIIQVGEQAGDHALSHHAATEAVNCYTTARRLLRERLPDPPARARLASIGERLAEALAGAGRLADAVAGYEELIAGADAPLDRSRLRRKLARVLGDVHGRFSEALALLEVAESELVDAPGPDAQLERGRIESARASAAFWRGEYRSAIAHGERALALWHGRPGVERDAMEQVHGLGSADQRLGNLKQAETRFRWALARAKTLGDRLFEVRCLNSLGAVLFHRARLAPALAITDDALRQCRELGAPQMEAISLVNRADKLTHLGELDAARADYEAALTQAEALDVRYTVMHTRVGLGEVLVRLGAFARARHVLEQGIALAQEIGNRQRLGHAYLYLAELALLDGDPAAARALAEHGLAVGEAIQDAHAVREGCPVLAQALLALGQPAAAEQAARRGLATARAGGFVLSEGRNLLARGQALTALGRAEEAASDLAHAERLFRAAGARYDLARALHARALTVLAGRARAAALAEALALARTTGARPLVSQIARARQRPQ